MIFDGKPARDISAEDIQRLVDEHVPEDQHLDYKAAPYPSTDRGRRELLKDVCAFANTDGGYIITGVHEDGQRRADSLVNVDDPEDARRSIIDRCLAGTDPRLTPDISIIEVDGNNVVVVRVPESGQKPHCARPDAEHHYFWRRYEDRNKIMSAAEIRECFEGDRVARELAALRREMEAFRRERLVARELETEIDDTNLFLIQTQERLLTHMDGQFLAEVGDQPYYRLLATPTPPIDPANLRDRREDLLRLLRSPPKLRDSGWDLHPASDLQPTAVGPKCVRTDFRHLRVFWNGHVEFWTSANDESFRWDELWLRTEGRVFLFPYAIIEPAAIFPLLVEQICDIAGHTGDVRFGLGLYNIEGRYLTPYAPDTLPYLRARGMAEEHGGPQPFNGRHLVTAPVTVTAPDLPDEVAWRLVSQVYYRFGYTDDQIPLFDEEHHCTLGAG